MAELKTKPTGNPVHEFLDALEDDQKREDSYRFLSVMQQATGEEPVMWGGSIVGFGSYHYKYESGREGDWFLTGFSPRKRSFSLYIMDGFGRYEELLQALGPHTTGKSCLYVKRAADIDMEVLRTLVRESVAHMKQKYAG